ncbi:hypothetical protein RSOLAG1IB_09847 [Rhizoctonia solani AG-1 IB]|uniref:Uncharacterized protein n=1 Tax=Thanatephorus cucumeris (strain AG1-IB / isolate 7/3/14) TaxID=1108050 RepID=A0A0B7FWG1_THACB|nr:hypothetical protein RSOLAG1IB_09847 [Rhizoctonia solani AG-1 IB]
MPESEPTSKASGVRYNEQPMDEDILFLGVNIPGAYSSIRANDSDALSRSVSENSENTTLNFVARTTNTSDRELCTVTQVPLPLANSIVFKIPSDNPVGPQLAYAWGFESASSLRFHLNNSWWNRMSLRVDFASTFESVYGGQWAMVPEIETLKKTSELTAAISHTKPPNYLDEFPNEIREYEYIPLRDAIEIFHRFRPGTKNRDGTTQYSTHKFPFQGLRLQSKAHPYFAIANTAQKVLYAQQGRSAMEHLSYEQQNSLTICVSIYEQWLKQGKAGSGTRVHH